MVTGPTAALFSEDTPLESTLSPAPPAVFGAIDAGSNGLRLAIARADSATGLKELKRIRSAVRLGHNAFTERRWDRDTLDRATAAFVLFRKMMDEFGAGRCRAVATSAAREASNSGELIHRIRAEAGIELEIIDGDEEARLVRTAVLARMGPAFSPRLVMDLGGGSLEINLLRGGETLACRTLPLGTVRLMEGHDIKGAIDAGEAIRIAQEVGSLLERSLPEQPDLSGAVAAACGGNAEALAKIAPGTPLNAMEMIDTRALEKRLGEILAFGVKERMKAYDVREDRAEVMGVAAIVLLAAAQWFRLERIVAPGVGVREGILQDFAAERFQSAAKGAVA